MGNLWLRIRLSLFVALGLLLAILLWQNKDCRIEPGVHFLLKTYEKPSLLLVLLLDTIFSIIAWWLFWTIFGYMRQMRTSRERNRLAKVERELAEQKAKAAMLQTRPSPPADSVK